MIGYEKNPNENVLYKIDKKENGIDVDEHPSIIKDKLPKVQIRITEKKKSDNDIALLRKDLFKDEIDYKSQLRRKEFVVNYAEGVRSLDTGNYSNAVACFEKALNYEPENEKVQEYLIGALYAEMGDISKRVTCIRRRLQSLSQFENKDRVKKCMVKMPVKKKVVSAKTGLMDKNGLLKHISLNTLH